MPTLPARQHMTFEQYLLHVNNSDRRYEYYDGEVYLIRQKRVSRKSSILARSFSASRSSRVLLPTGSTINMGLGKAFC